MRFPGDRREWALGMAFMLCMVFLYIMHFLTNFYASPEMLQAQVFNMIGSIAGVLPLPLGALRSGGWPPVFSQGLVLLGPSLLLLSHSETIFLVLYTLNATLIQLIVVGFPFAVLDLYWKESRPGGRGYWAWLLAVSMNVFRVLAGAGNN